MAALVELLAGLGTSRAIVGPADPTGCDLVFNATPVRMEETDPLPIDTALLTPSMFVGDVIAGRCVTPFIRAAQDTGCKVANGVHMVEAGQDLMADFVLRNLHGSCIPVRLFSLR